MTCQKCKGLMVKEWRPEFSQEAAVLRCINCGLVLDPLIAQNRVTTVACQAAGSEGGVIFLQSREPVRTARMTY